MSLKKIKYLWLIRFSSEQNFSPVEKDLVKDRGARSTAPLPGAILILRGQRERLQELYENFDNKRATVVGACSDRFAWLIRSK